MPDQSVRGSRPGRPRRGTGARGLSALARQAAAKTRAVSGRVHDHAVVTPLIGLAAAGEECGTEILLKREHLHRTGSFKVRGALAKLLSLGEGQRDRGVVAASSGNHGSGWRMPCLLSAGQGSCACPSTRPRSRSPRSAATAWRCA
jgi:threonine dehydratase